MEFKNDPKIIERENELEDLSAMKKALIKKGLVSDAEIKAEKK